MGGALGVDSASANGEEFVNLHSSPNSACPYMVNLLGGYQDVMNECTQVDAHNAAVQSAFQSPHASLSKYGHVTTHTDSLCTRGNADQLFPCRLFDVNSSLGRGWGRPQFYNEQQVKEFLTTFPNAVSNVQLSDLKFDSQDILKCVKQQDCVFGFIPLTSLSRNYSLDDLDQALVLSQGGCDPVACHKMVRESHQYNCQKCHIQLSDSIDFEYLFSFGQDYWDYQLFAFLKYGFPLDFDRQNTFLCPTLTSHNSAKSFPHHVLTYLQEEEAQGAIFGPFPHPPPPFGINTHISPFITREKSDSEKRRVIIDLSFPPDHSVNSGVSKNIYLGTAFKLHYPTIDMITQRLCDLGPGAHIYKIDLARAFRQLFVDPSDWDLLGLYWDGNYYGDCRVPFGYRNGSMFQTRFTDYIRYIMRSKGHHIVNYVDDLLGLENEGHSRQSYEFLMDFLDRAGFPISLSKLAPPSTTCICLGVVIDTVKETVTIPPDKLHQILNKCALVLQSKQISKNQLQSLLGSLMFLQGGSRPPEYLQIDYWRH